MYKRKIKLSYLRLIYLNGSTANVYYPGVISSNTLLRRLKKGDPVFSRVNGEYRMALVSTTNLAGAVLMGYVVVRVETDVFDLMSASAISTIEEHVHGQDDTFASD